MMPDWLHILGQWFTPDRYLFWTHLQGAAWTCADIVIVYYLIRISNVCRLVVVRSPHCWPYALLASTLPFSVLLPFARSGYAFFYLSLCTTLPHFLLILYLIVANRHTAPEALRRLVLERKRSPAAISP